MNNNNKKFMTADQIGCHVFGDYVIQSDWMAQKYRKIPVCIEAIKYTGNNLMDCLNFIGGTAGIIAIDKLTIKTLEGDMNVSIGDYIIKGIKGEFYPCKPDIFEITYEVLE